MSGAPSRCDLHVHSVFSTDSGNYALRRARLGESYTEPGRVYEACRRRGMTLVTISDHNTVEGALRIAHLPDTFLSVEVTTRFPGDELPLHVLVWNLTEADHRDLQPWRPSVYELVAFLRERGLTHALAHPLYRMGPPLTAAHIEKLMLLFALWEGRNGARPRETNELACRLAAAGTPEYLAKLGERHQLAAGHERIRLTAGSDDHGALDIATTWTEAPGATPAEFLAAVYRGRGEVHGQHGSSVKLAHAAGALFLNAYRAGGRALPTSLGAVAELFDVDADDASERHRQIEAATALAVRGLSARARAGGLDLDALPSLGSRLGALLLAGGLELPYLAAAQHQTGARSDLAELESSFFPLGRRGEELRTLVFTDTYEEANGVAGTMRRLAAAGGERVMNLSVVAACAATVDEPGLLGVEPDWSVGLPGYESLELRFPSLTRVLALVEEEQPGLVHLATPGPVGLCGLVAARLLGLPVVGSYHTELGPYALQLTRDALVADAFGIYVDWFYRQCQLVLAPTSSVAAALEQRGHQRVNVWGRGVDAELFKPDRRREHVRRRLLDGGDLLLLYVGRLSPEKRIHVLLEAFARLRGRLPGLRLAIAGDGPAREQLVAAAPAGVRFVGELRGLALAELYASADIFCFPSTTDTFGQVLLEAAASGLPAIAAEAGGAVELVRDGATGPARQGGRSGLTRTCAHPARRGPRAAAAPGTAGAADRRDANLARLVRAARRRIRGGRRHRASGEAAPGDRRLALPAPQPLRHHWLRGRRASVPTRVRGLRQPLSAWPPRGLGSAGTALVRSRRRLVRLPARLAARRARRPRRPGHARRPLDGRCARDRCRGPPAGARGGHAADLARGTSADKGDAGEPARLRGPDRPTALSTRRAWPLRQRCRARPAISTSPCTRSARPRPVRGDARSARGADPDHGGRLCLGHVDERRALPHGCTLARRALPRARPHRRPHVDAEPLDRARAAAPRR